MSKSLKNIGVISVLTVVSRVLGLVRDSLGLAIFGAGELYSAFLTAFIVPNLFRRLLAEGSMTAAFLPTLQGEFGERGREGAFELLSKVTSWLIVATGLLTALAMALLGHSRWIPGQEDKWYLAADLAVLLFPYLAMISLSAAFSAALNVLHRFTEPALSPIWLNLAMIASLAGAGLHYASSPTGEILWLCGGVLAGGFLQMAVPAAVLVAEGWRPRFDLALSPKVREIASLMAPGLFGTAIYQINFSVSRLVAFSLDDASATYLFTMNRLMELPVGVFAIAVATVVYPLIARYAAAGDRRSMAAAYQKGIRLIMVLNIPAAVGLGILSEPIVRMVYEHGRLTEAAAGDMAILLGVLVIGLPFFSVVSLTVRAFYSFKDTATPVRVAVVDFVINIGATLVLTRWMGVLGIAIASTTAVIAQTLLLQRALVRRFPEMGLQPLVRSVPKVLVATALMAAVVAAGKQGIAAFEGVRFGPFWGAFLQVAVLVPVGVGVYAGVLWLLRIEGREDLEAVFRRSGRSL